MGNESCFLDSRARIARAWSHQVAFSQEWESLQSSEAFRPFIEISSDWTWGVAKAIPVKAAKNSLALEIGEFFYQLRAALDAAVYEASALAERRRPPSNENRIEFPICTDSKKFKANAINISPFPEKLRDWIETIQPYNAAETAHTKYSALNGYLELLHDCARKDRHRRLHIVGAVPKRMEWQFDISPPGSIVSSRSVPCNFLEGETEFLRFGIAGVGATDPCKIKLKTTVSMQIRISEFPVPQGGDLGTELNHLRRFVTSVIDVFDLMFS